MFFRHRRLSAKKSRTLLIELFDQRYQWSLRMPLIHLLARGDSIRFLCSLRFVVDGISRGICLLNRQPPSQDVPCFADHLQATLNDFPIHPSNLLQRLTTVMRLDDPAAAELEARRLAWEIIDLTPREKKRRQEQESPPVVTWLPRVADLEIGVEPPPSAGGDPNQAMRLARRAVRIVWRLPGSRLATLTGSVVAGYSDLASDIDINLFGLKLPNPQVRRSLIAATSDVPDDISQVSHETYAADTFWLEDRLIDVRYFLIEEARRLIERPVPQSRADYEMLAHLSTADVLVDYESRGPDLLQDLQRATREARPERMTRASAELDQALSRLGVAQDSPAIFYATTQALLALFQLLAARNDRWIVFPKWTADWLDGLEHAPADAHQRLSAVVLLPFLPENVAAKAQVLRALAGETQAL